MKVIGDIATVLNTTVDYLLNHADIHSMETCQKVVLRRSSTLMNWLER